MTREEIISAYLESSSKNVEDTLQEIKEIQKVNNDKLRKVIASL